MENELKFKGQPCAKAHYASLLDLDPVDYEKLSHSGFRSINGLDGRPMSFYTIISPLNPKPLLDRLKNKMNKQNVIYVSADAISAKDLPGDFIS